jgi:AsmA protein
MRWLKRLLAAILVLCALPIIAIAILVTLVDPNSLKPELQKQAAKHGVFLALDGDLSWQFFPNIGLGVEQIALLENQQATQSPLASIEHASFSVALAPLLSQQIQVNGIEVSGVNVDYRIAQDGSTNWDAMLAAQEQPEGDDQAQDESSADASGAPSIAIDKIVFNGLNFRYQDAQSASEFSANDVSLSLSGFNLDGRQFPMSASGRISASELPTLSIDLNASSSVNLNATTLSISKLDLVLSSDDKAKFEVASEVALNWQSMQGDISLSANSDTIRAWLNHFAPGVANDMHDAALQTLSFESELKLNGDQYAIPSLALQFDQTRIEATADLELGDIPKLKTAFSGDKINLDHYLPSTEGTEVEEETVAEDSPLPLESLRGFDADAEFKFGEVIVKNVEVKNLLSQVSANRGLMDLKTLQADIDQGGIQAKGQFDARPEVAKLQADVVASDLNLQYLLTKVADFDQLSGQLGGEIQLQSRGASSLALSKNLQASANFNSEQVRLVPINLVKSFCEAGAFIEGTQVGNHDWPEFTEFSPLTLKAGLANEVATLQSFDASIEKFAAKANGEFDIAKGSFDFPFSLQLADFASELEGCEFISEKWRKQALPLRCKGTLETVGAGTCLPDLALLREKLKQNVQREVEKEKDRLEEKAAEKAEDLLDKHLKEDDKKKLKDLLKGL